MKLRRFWQLALCLGGIITIFQPPNVKGQTELSSDQTLAFESAWNHRKDVIKSLALKANIIEIRKGRGEQPAQPAGLLSDNAPKTDRQFVTKVEYYYEQGKTAITRTGLVSTGDDSNGVAEQTFRTTFDGQLTASLLEQASHRSGSFEKKRSAGGFISQNGHLLAVNLWIQPQLTLDGIGWNVKGMKVENHPVEVDGIECKQIRLPRKGSPQTSLIDVDAAREWIPIQWQIWQGERLTMKLSIQYGIDKKVGPLVSGWNYVSYNNVGESELIRKGVVTSCDVNVKIDPSHFTIKFPIGTHLWEDIDGGRRYYLQKADGMSPVDYSSGKHKAANQ